jgi:hypothetical protein
MTFQFSPARGLVLVSARIDGPTRHTYAELALDTGASVTLIRPAKLVSIGYDPAVSPDRVQVTTGSGVEYVVRLPVVRKCGSRHGAPTPCSSRAALPRGVSVTSDCCNVLPLPN